MKSLSSLVGLINLQGKEVSQENYCRREISEGRNYSGGRSYSGDCDCDSGSNCDCSQGGDCNCTSQNCDDC